MDQIPATAPKVTFEAGRLAISADNATLGQILRDVSKLTGASIDLPPGGGNERVVTNLGPGAPREILAHLLDGVPFNYVILGSAADPAVIATVILTAKPGTPGPESQTQTVAYQPAQAEVPPVRMPQSFRGAMLPQNMRPGEQPGAAGDNSDDSDSADDSDDADQAQPAQPGQAMGQPPENENQDANDGNQPNAGPKTPEQLLEMIRRGQSPAPPAANPPQQPPQN